MKNLILLFCILFGANLFGQEVDYGQIDQYLNKTFEEWQLPGMAVGIVYKGELVFAKGYGELEVGKGQKPDEHTNYAIASNSKAFTATVLAMLVQEGKLDWKDKVQKYLPYFEVYDPVASQMVTIEDLLSHRVGVGTFSGDCMWYDSTLTTEEVVRRAKYIPQAFEIRDGFGYSNVMYVAAGDIIEKVTGKSWGQNVEERILKPLDMDRTVYSLKQLQNMKNVATPHATVNGKNVKIRWENWDQVAAAGGLMSNIDDLAKWVIFNMSDGVVDKDTLLTAASRNEIWKIQNSFPVDHLSKSVNAPDFAGYGLGFGLTEYKNHFKVSHTGGFGGMLTSITMLPDDDLAVIFLSNDTESPLRGVPNYIINRFIDPYDETDYAAESLLSYLEGKQADTRISDLKAKRIKGTTMSKSLSDYVGSYYSDLYGGNINVTLENNQLKLSFEFQPNLNATLSHWHYDTFAIDWDQIQPWFGFGLLQFDMNPSQEIIGLSFDVPNDDFFFEEFKARVKK